MGRGGKKEGRGVVDGGETKEVDACLFQRGRQLAPQNLTPHPSRARHPLLPRAGLRPVLCTVNSLHRIRHVSSDR